jgi:hypothetical protein
MQTSYTQFQPEAVLGMMSEDFTRYVDTVIPQVAVKTGVMLTADKTAGKVRNAAKLPTSAAEITKPGAMGVVILDATREIVAGATLDWPALRPTPVLRRGRIWVLAETDLARWTYPYVRFAGTGVAGSFRADADTANAAQLTNAIILTDAAAGELALLELDLF